MQPRPIHRWKSFWFGILVMGFLGWAWRISYDYSSFVNYRRLVLTHAEGYASIRRGWATVADDLGHSRVKRGQYDFQLAPPPFFIKGQGRALVSRPFVGSVKYRADMKWAYGGSPRECWGMFLPHWLLILLFAVSWSAFLVWRIRKREGRSGSGGKRAAAS